MTDAEGYILAHLVAFVEEGMPDGLVIDAIDPGPARDGDPLDESVTYRNAAREPVGLSGYTNDLGGGQRDDLPEVTLDSGASLMIHIGSSTDTATDYSLSRERATLNDKGDTVALLDPDGGVSTRRVYT